MKKEIKKTIKSNIKSEKVNIKETFDKLDKILKNMEKENLDIEKNLKLYEEALSLISSCKKSIEESKAKLEILEEE